jgi:hypothetical protein
MTPEPISTAYFINPSHQTVCLHVYPPNVVRQRFGKNVNAATNIHATIKKCWTRRFLCNVKKNFSNFRKSEAFPEKHQIFSSSARSAPILHLSTVSAPSSGTPCFSLVFLPSSFQICRFLLLLCRPHFSFPPGQVTNTTRDKQRLRSKMSKAY